MRAVLTWTVAVLTLLPGPAVSQITGPGSSPDDLPGVRVPVPRATPPAEAKPAPQAKAQDRAGPEADRAPDPAADARAKAAAAEAALSPAERLDTFFAELKREPDATAAAKIALRIESEWSTSGSDTVDLLLGWAGEAMAKDDKAAALDLLGEAIVLKPDYAESWNRRATLHFLDDDYGKSIYDIEQTLRLEPRHYGALMGLGAILEQTDRKPQALEAYTKALAVYPALKSAQDAVARLSEELAGQAI